MTFLSPAVATFRLGDRSPAGWLRSRATPRSPPTGGSRSTVRRLRSVFCCCTYRKTAPPRPAPAEAGGRPRQRRRSGVPRTLGTARAGRRGIPGTSGHCRAPRKRPAARALLSRACHRHASPAHPAAGRPGDAVMRGQPCDDDGSRAPSTTMDDHGVVFHRNIKWPTEVAGKDHPTTFSNSYTGARRITLSSLWRTCAQAGG